MARGSLVRTGGTQLSTERSEGGSPRRWRPFAFAALLAVSAFFNLFALAGEGYGNVYYAAAVKSMLTSFHDFFFVSFDSGGFVSVDKPPLGLWLQAAFAKLLGFSGWAVILPQALAGVASVAVLYHLIRRAFGAPAGLIAGLALALTPIVVATSRNNTMDMTLVLLVLLAAWAFTVAAERGSLGWLVVGAVVIGLGFNVKMLQAYLVVPALYALYLLAARATWPRRVVQLGIASVALVVVSLSWAVVVDLTPEDQRPYVGSSQTNSVLELAFGYNGLDRLTGSSGGPGGGGAQAGMPGGPGSGPLEYGEAGVFRLVNTQLGGQASWLLPFALVGAVSLFAGRRLRLPLDRRGAALVLWGTWLLTMGVYFSVAGGGHRYYLVMIAPAIAAFVGAGAVSLWDGLRNRRGWRGWLLPLAVLLTVVVQARFLLSSGPQGLVLLALLATLGLGATAALVVGRFRDRPQPAGSAWAAPEHRRTPRYLIWAAATSALALFLAPTVWSAYPVFTGTDTLLPSAGPQTGFMGMGGGMPSAAPTGGGQTPFGGQQFPGGQVPGGGQDGGQQMPDGMQMPDDGSEEMPEGMPEDMPEGMPEDMPFPDDGSGFPFPDDGTQQESEEEDQVERIQFFPDGSGSGSGQFPDGMQMPDGSEMPDDMPLPDGSQMPDDMQMPYGMQPPDDSQDGGQFPGGMMAGGMMGGSGVDAEMLAYLQEEQGETEYLFATQSATSAAPYILETDEPVMATGGFLGTDPILTADEVSTLVEEDTVRFFMMPSFGGSADATDGDATGTSFQGGGLPFAQDDGGNGQMPSFGGGMAGGMGGFGGGEVMGWVQENCEQVPAEQYGGDSDGSEASGAPFAAQALYDCGSTEGS